MPKISDLRNKNAARIQAGGKTGTGVGNPQPPQASIQPTPTAPQDLPVGAGLPQRGMFSADLVLASDRSDSSRVFRGQGMRSATFPYQPQTIKTSPVIVTPATVSAAAAASSLALQTNGIANPNQKLQNLVNGAGISIVANPDGSVIITAAENGANAFELIDNFHAALGSANISGTAPGSGIGQLGWALLGDTGGEGGIIGGTFPNVGQFGWTNSGVASQAGWLTFGGSGGFSSAEYSQLSWGIADTPGSILTYTFKLEAPSLSPTNAFSMAQSAVYIGLTGPNINPYSSSISRPNFFIGVRYDTSTTAPSINDSFFTLEVVSNPVTVLDTYARNNTQGTTFVTSIAPTAGVWHTLTLDFTVAGSVTLTLDGQATLTATIPTLTVFGTISANVENGAALLSWTVGASTPQSFWNAGTLITASGFGAPLELLNGVWSLTASEENAIGFDVPGTTSGSSTATLTGFPSMIPLVMMGNDDTAAPTSDSRMMVIDFFSLIWNPLSS